MNLSSNTPDRPTGAQLRDEGIQAVLDGDNAPHRNYREDVERVMDQLVTSGLVFTADDVRRMLPEDVRQHAAPNLIPAIFAAYRCRKVITQMGWATSGVPSRHRGVQREWCGIQKAEEAA